MKLQYTNRKRRSRIDLRSDERCPFGISVTERQKDTDGPTIKNIKQGSVAHKSHCLAVGDVILSINGQDTRSMRKKDVKRLFKENPLITIEVEYFSKEVSCSKIQCSQRTSLTLKKENGSFGFVVRKDVTEYPLISNVKRDGPADKHGSMMAGDRLLEVDNQSLSWISLTEVASILQEKDEAVFLIEYNVGIISFSQKEVEIEIDCPDSNIGMTVNTFTNDSSRMYIATIQQGGLTQRCGVFHVGDEILSVYDMEVKAVTTLKVNDLLRRLKKRPGKLKFVHSREISQENLSRKQCMSNNSKTESTADLGMEEDPHRELDPGNDAYQAISLNSHSPSNCSISSRSNSLTEKDFIKKVAYNTVFDNTQLKTLSVLRDINLNIANLQLCLSRYDRKAAHLDQDNSETDIIEHIEINPRNGEPKSRYSKLETECLTIRNLIRDLSFHCIKNTGQLEPCSHSIESRESSSNKLPNTGSVGVELMYHLNEMIAAYKYVPMTSVKNFISDINKIDTNCYICKERCYLALFAVRKILLLLSLNEQTSQTATLTRKVLSKVTDINIPCEECKISVSTKTGAQVSAGQSRCLSSLEASSCSSNKSNISQPASSIRTKRCETIYEPHVGLDVVHQKAIYRLIDLPSLENSYSTTTVDNFADIKRHSYPIYSNMAVFHSTVNNVQNGLKYSAANSSKLFHDNPQEKKVPAQTMNSSWESTEIVCNPQEELEQKFPSVICTSTAPKFPAPEPTGSNQRVTNKCGFEFTKEQHHSVETNIRPKSIAMEIEDGIPRHKETHRVTLKSDEGYGLFLGYDCVPKPGSVRIPIITAMRPNSPSERIGLLKIGDRILAINGRSTINSTVNDLEILKREAFSHEEITLNVEFDVNEPILKYGTFEIKLEENLKVGLVMDEHAIPCKVKGLVKGGSAHRSGQVFPGDLILSFGSTKNENLDLQTQTKTKSKTFHLVVQRELDNSEVVANKPPEYIYDPASLVRKGPCFDLKRTSVRTMEGYNDIVFLEQEFTLFRDPVTWDFGFLFGEDPRTGRSYITGIRPNSPADNSKAVKQNDRIIEVNGVLIDGSRENSVMSLIMSSSDNITLVTRRIIHYR